MDSTIMTYHDSNREIRQKNNYCCMGRLKDKGHLRWCFLINSVLVSVLFALEFSPFLNRNISPAVRLYTIVLWLFSSALCKKKIELKNYYLLVFTAAYIFMQFFAFAIGNTTLYWSALFYRLSIYIVPFIMLFVIKEYRDSELKFLTTILVSIIIYNIISNCVLYYNDPNPYVYGGIYQVYSTTNKGSSTFVAALFLLSLVLVYLINNSKGFCIKALCWLFIVICFYYVAILNPRATSVFLMVSGISILLIIGKMKSGKKTVLFVLFVLIALLIVYLNVDLILDFLIDNISEDRIVSRIENIKLFLQRDFSNLSVNDGSFSQRIILASKSMETFISNPLLGIGEKAVSVGSVSELLASGVGGHSEFIDCLAEYGIIGSIIIYTYVWNIYKCILSFYNYSAPKKRQIKVILCLFTIYGFLNNYFETIYFYVVFLFFPIVIRFIEGESNDEVHTTDL